LDKEDPEWDLWLDMEDKDSKTTKTEQEGKTIEDLTIMLASNNTNKKEENNTLKINKNLNKNKATNLLFKV